MGPASVVVVVVCCCVVGIDGSLRSGSGTQKEIVSIDHVMQIIPCGNSGAVKQLLYQQLSEQGRNY